MNDGGVHSEWLLESQRRLRVVVAIEALVRVVAGDGDAERDLTMMEAGLVAEIHGERISLVVTRRAEGRIVAAIIELGQRRLEQQWESGSQRPEKSRGDKNWRLISVPVTHRPS